MVRSPTNAFQWFTDEHEIQQNGVLLLSAKPDVL